MTDMLDLNEFKRRYQKVPVEEYPNCVRTEVPNPVLTVHLITYNHVDYIQKAIDSVLMQEVDFPMEIILGDDDSSDGTREICIEYAKQYPELIRLQLHHRDNNHSLYGQPTHFFQYWYNTLSARGEYIAVLSGDDYWTDSDKLQKQVSFLVANPEFSLTHHNAVVVDSQGRVKRGRYFPSAHTHSIDGSELLQAPLVVASSTVFRNVFSRLPDSFMSSFHEDRLITSTLGKHGYGKYYDSIKCAYRKNISGMWDGTDQPKRISDKISYLNIIVESVCESGSCRRKAALQQVQLEEALYRTLVNDSEYQNAFKVALRVFRRYASLGKISQAARWILRSSRFLLGKLRQVLSGMALSS
jgi:glycosyltransferase involved in cell wall biosynthesis